MATLLKSCVLTCSGCRDYIHVMDLAEGHVAALKQILDPTFKGLKIYNLGRYLFKSGGGDSVWAIKNCNCKHIFK